jgi:hypothetical protein
MEVAGAVEMAVKEAAAEKATDLQSNFHHHHIR